MQFTARLQSVQKSTFFMNALFLMMSTFIVGVTGFIFWVLITRNYEATEVGVATALLSISGLVSLLGLAGFDTTFVRFLPGSTHKNDYTNSGFTIVTFVSAGLAMCTAAALPFLSPNFAILGGDWAFVAFVFFTVVSSLSALVSAVFLAHKRARYILAISGMLGLSKILLPLLVAPGSALTIFVIAGISQLAGLVWGLIWMCRKFDYAFSALFDMNVVRVVRKFSFSMYASSILNLLPPTLLPLLVVHLMGPADAAYYYMAFTIAGALYTIAYASMQSVFAEGSHDAAAIRAHVVKALKLVAILLVPATLLIAALASFLLGWFGHEYAREATTLLQLFALGALPVAVYSAMGAIFKVTKNLRGIVCMNAVYAAITLGAAYWLAPSLGLPAIGVAWIIGNVAACSMGALFLVNGKKHKERIYGKAS